MKGTPLNSQGASGFPASNLTALGLGSVNGPVTGIPSSGQTDESVFHNGGAVGTRMGGSSYCHTCTHYAQTNLSSLLYFPE